MKLKGRSAQAYTGGQPWRPEGPVVVLIHGALHDHSVWALQSRALAHGGWRVLALDLPGHGDSAGPALPSIEDLAAWVVDGLDTLGVERAALVGHSMGALIALEAASRLGPRATHLALLGAACPMTVSPQLMSTAQHDPLAAIDLVNAYSHASWGAKPSAPAPGFWLHGVNRALMRRQQQRHATAGHGNLFHLDFQACDGYAHGFEAAAHVRCPTLMLVGRADQMTPPRAAARLAEALQAHTTVLSAGHAMMSEQPDAVLDALRAFLASPSGPPQPR